MNVRKNEQGIAMPAVIALIALVLVAGGVIYFQSNRPDEVMEKDGQPAKNSSEENLGGQVMEEDSMMSEDNMEGDEQMMDEDDSMMEDEMMMEGDLSISGKVIAGTSAKLVEFNQADYEAALKTDKLVVLYYYANWCPVCREETQNALYPAFDELGNDNVIGFRVNYNDNETDNNEKDLAREHGVAYQHTKVFVKNGERILKSPESWDKDRYFDEIEKNIK